MTNALCFSGNSFKLPLGKALNINPCYSKIVFQGSSGTVRFYALVKALAVGQDNVDA